MDSQKSSTKEYGEEAHPFRERRAVSLHRHDSNIFRHRVYSVFSAAAYSELGKQFERHDPRRFKYHDISWGKFPDQTDDIRIGGFVPINQVAGKHVLFLASFHNNDITLSQFSALIVLLTSFIETMTIVLPFYPVGTMERVEVEGRVPTAYTYALLLSSLPSCGRPIRLIIYDIHALQERFYFHGSTIPSLHSTIPLLLARLPAANITTIAFPDDGAAKRFKAMFDGYDIIVCGKIRDGAKRVVKISDGDPEGKRIVIVDDLVQSGGTLHECAGALKKAGALEINAFVAHGVFPNRAWERFSRTCNGSGKDDFRRFWVTNSIPHVAAELPSDDVFEVIDLFPQIIEDIDVYPYGSFEE